VCTLPSNRPTKTSFEARPARRLPRLAGERAAALIYTGTSFVAALVFWLVTTLTGDFTNVARWGGAAWIFLLMMIVLMPIVIPRMKRRAIVEEPTACSLPGATQQPTDK
jgi:hypothetical protein